MLVRPTPEQQKIYGFSTEDTAAFNWFNRFLGFRDDETAPFSCEEIISVYPICRCGKTFAPRAGDKIIVLEKLPRSIKVSAMLRVRHCSGLYGLMCRLKGFVITDRTVFEVMPEDFYIINPHSDAKLLELLDKEKITCSCVGYVAVEGCFILMPDGEYEPLEIEPVQPKTVQTSADSSFVRGYIAGMRMAFEGKEETAYGNVNSALGVFSAFYNIRYKGNFSYSGAEIGDALFLYRLSESDNLPAKGARSFYKQLCRSMRKNVNITGCVLFSNGDLLSAARTLLGDDEYIAPFPRLQEDVFYALVASKKPMRNGHYLGKL